MQGTPTKFDGSQQTMLIHRTGAPARHLSNRTTPAIPEPVLYLVTEPGRLHGHAVAQPYRRRSVRITQPSPTVAIRFHEKNCKNCKNLTVTPSFRLRRSTQRSFFALCPDQCLCNSWTTSPATSAATGTYPVVPSKRSYVGEIKMYAEYAEQ